MVLGKFLDTIVWFHILLVAHDRFVAFCCFKQF